MRVTPAVFPAMSATRTVTRIWKVLFAAFPSGGFVTSLSVHVTFVPVVALPVSAGAGRAKGVTPEPVKSALAETNASPAGSASMTDTFCVTPSGSVMFSAYVTVSPMPTLLPAVAASLVETSVLVIVGVATVLFTAEAPTA